MCVLLRFSLGLLFISGRSVCRVILNVGFFFSSRRRHTRCALVTGVQTCALPISRRLNETFRPTAVVGFGGYPAMPALLGALADGIPTAIHEQNAVLGRVNRYLAGRVDAIATAYPDVERLKDKYAEIGRAHV